MKAQRRHGYMSRWQRGTSEEVPDQENIATQLFSLLILKFPLEFIPLNKESVVFLKSFKFFNDIENLESVDIDFSDNFTCFSIATILNANDI